MGAPITLGLAGMAPVALGIATLGVAIAKSCVGRLPSLASVEDAVVGAMSRATNSPERNPQS